MSEQPKDPKTECSFDFSAYPPNTAFHERRMGKDRRGAKPAGQPAQSESKPQRKERRRRIDPTTFEKQYTEDEMEFMNAMQRFKERAGKSFPSYGEVIKVAMSLGYRKVVEADPPAEKDDGDGLSVVFPSDQPDE